MDQSTSRSRPAVNTNQSIISNGIIGLLASTGTVLTTFQTQFDWWVRNIASVGGILVTIVTLYNLIQKSLNKP